jgi:hypothetical protein
VAGSTAKGELEAAGEIMAKTFELPGLIPSI